MKAKKRIIGLILLCILLVMQFNFVCAYDISVATYKDEFTEKSNYSNLKYMAEQSMVGDVANNFETELVSDKNVAKQGEEIEVTIKIKNLEKEIYAIGGKIEFDKNILEIIEDEVTGLDSWKFSINDYNLDNFKFVADTSVATTGTRDIIKLKFRVKEDAQLGTTTISLKEIKAGTGEITNGILYAADSSLDIEVEEKEVPPVESITSDIYEINNENKTISKIPEGTTVAEFKTNVTTEQAMVFTDAEGNVLGDDAVLENGMKLKVGETLEYTLVVETEVPPVESITSDIYEINNENKTISKIPEGTTVAEFKTNVTTEQAMVFTDAEGNVLGDDAVLENGMKLKVGETLEYTLVVETEVPPVESITSDVYEINNENKTISKIPEGTTVAEFKTNVKTEQAMVFTDAEGNVLGDDAVLENGMKLKVGETLEYTLVVEIEVPPVEKYFRSNIYDVNNENGKITKISIKTTVSDFKNNIETNMELTFTDAEGNTLAEDAFVGTGMKLRLEDGTEFVLVVTADIDGDGVVGIDDIAKLKLHYIERELLEGIQLEAADVDVDSEITINDVAKMKLIYIEMI